jgi:hypothetical protein
MSILRTAFLLSVTVFMPCLSWSQQDQQPVQLSPEVAKILRQQEQTLNDALADAHNHPGPTFSAEQCRSDTQKWTAESGDAHDPRNLIRSTSVMVNGQYRAMPVVTANLPFTDLLSRIYEMAVCERTDAAFETQFGTYTLMGRLYTEQKMDRYVGFIMNHSMYNQFLKEDGEKNK